MIVNRMSTPKDHLCFSCAKAARPPFRKNDPECSCPEDVKWGGEGIYDCPEYEESGGKDG
jgi:hypothetical protein